MSKHQPARKVLCAQQSPLYYISSVAACGLAACDTIIIRMKTLRSKRAGFINEAFFRLQLFLSLLSLILIFIAGSITVRVLIVIGVIGFFAFVKWYIWKITLRPGARVKVMRGEYSGLRGVVHPEHNPQRFVKVRVILTQNGEEIIQEFSQYNVEKA